MKHKISSAGGLTSLSLAIAAVIVVGVSSGPSSLQARVIERQKTTGDWRTLSELDVGSGSTIPQGRHVFFHVPAQVNTIDREVLLGGRGAQVLYWGYCFPGENDAGNLAQSVGFPGKIFLSEAERARRKAIDDRRNAFLPFRPLTAQPQRLTEEGPIHHQLDTFRGGMTCYIMTDKPLPIGIDADNDGLNSQLERGHNTNPQIADTDGDGLSDGIEVRTGTNPNRRDTDGDGLLDGIEDANHNGRFEGDETDPRVLDSDGDTLCDGFCHVFRVRKMCKDNKGIQCTDIPYGQMMGEDKNFNGKVDKGETDPRKASTAGDGINDDVRFYKCLLDGKKDC